MRVTQRKGDMAVTQAIATFTQMGFDVSLPITESAPYDLVVDVEEVLVRVQVRYSSSGSVDLRRVHSNSKGYVVKKVLSKVYDWLYVYKADGTQYLIKECMIGRRSFKPTEEFLVGMVLSAKDAAN